MGVPHLGRAALGVGEAVVGPRPGPALAVCLVSRRPAAHALPLAWRADALEGVHPPALVLFSLLTVRTSVVAAAAAAAAAASPPRGAVVE